MKKLLALSLVVLLALTACPHNNKVDPNAPLALTVENLAGKWVLESDANIWMHFEVNNNYSDSDNLKGTFKILSNNTVQVDTLSILNVSMSETYTVTIYNGYMEFSTKKYLKSNQ